MNISEPTTNFASLGIAPKLLEILERNKYSQPTPIQQQSIPIAIEGKDLMGIAQTGTGKTLAFGIPMIQTLAQGKGLKKGLVIVPTRELAIQVDETLRKVGTSLGLKTAVLIGGESMHKQMKAIGRNPHIIVATPGRLNDHIVNAKLNLSQVQILVLDEADRMLDMGFAPQIKKILEKVPKQRQTMLFSATMPNEIVTLANSYMSLPLRVEVAPAGTAIKLVTQEIFFLDRNLKNEMLKTVLTQYNGSVLVFTKTKHKAKDVARIIRGMSYTANEIHSNRSLGQRKEALEGFKIGRYRVLVATDIAARGIDVTGIQLVISYDLPATAEDYVHRIGRTGRAGMTGHAISFATHDQRHDVKNIERVIKKALTISQTPALVKDKTMAAAPYEPERGFGRSSSHRSAPRSSSGRSSYAGSRPSHSSAGRSEYGSHRTPSRTEHRPSSRFAPSTGSNSDYASDSGNGDRKPFNRSSRKPSYPKTKSTGQLDGGGYFMKR